MSQMLRLPVVFQGKPLMPMKASRVRRFLKNGKAKIRYDRKLGIHYVQLLIDPSAQETQEITVALDPGSTFDGVAVVSGNTHHLNIELIQRPKRGKNAITAFKKRQAANRRVRRSRLRHRPIRFDNRTSNKLSPTIKANVDYRKWLLLKLARYYPITRAVVEDVKFNHSKSKKGKSFSHVEQGKVELYRFITELGWKLVLVEGFTTKRLRVNSFGYDAKAADKGAKNFEAHCLDAFVMACGRGNLFDMATGEVLAEEPYITFDHNHINKKVIFIEKLVKQRRSLTRTRALYKDKWRYYRYAKGGIKVYFTSLSNKQAKCRIKPEGEQSNHPIEWEYLDNGRAEKVKSNTAQYGGTVINGKQKFYKDSAEWINRVLSVTDAIKPSKAA